MTTILPSLCLSCARRSSDSDAGTGTPLANRCAAYPGGIPQDIRDGADHRMPRGDERDGLVYEPIADAADAALYFNAWQRFAAA